jgi:hypothetical protein
VRGGENLNWGGLKVIYDGTSNIYPNDSNISVTVWDDDGDFWSNISVPGEEIDIISSSDITTDLLETFAINITGIPSECDLSSVDYLLKIEGDNVTFSNPIPNEAQWQTVIKPDCGVTISDTTTKVNSSSIQYQISIDNGTTWDDWIDLGSQTEDAESIECVAAPILKEGSDNLIKWRARDILGNGYNYSIAYRILVDVSNVTFIDARPSSNEWQDNMTVACNITIMDNISGIEADSIEYQVSTDGIINYGLWQSVGKITDGNIINCSVTTLFDEGEDNYIRWRARDLAGNGPYVSKDYQIKILANLPPVTTLLSPANNSILQTLTPELKWEGTDPNGDAPIYYNVYISSDRNQIMSLDDSALKTLDHTETSYKLVAPLDDKETYYWTAIPNDGAIDGICSSGIWQFKIDIDIEIPTVELISPINNSDISSTTPVLLWTSSFSEPNLLSYDIYLNESLDSNVALKVGHFETSYIPEEPLNRGQIYYWTVVPIAHLAEGNVIGKCLSGIWNFKVETAEFNQTFGVDLTLQDPQLKVKPGGSIETNISVINSGNNVDLFEVEINLGDLDANYILERENQALALNSSEKITLKLRIEVFENVIEQDYSIYIKAVSIGASSQKKNVSIVKSITIEVLQDEDKNGKSKSQPGSNLFLWIGLIIIAVIVVIIVFILISRKKKPEEAPTLEPELLLPQPSEQPRLEGATPTATPEGLKPVPSETLQLPVVEPPSAVMQLTPAATPQKEQPVPTIKSTPIIPSIVTPQPKLPPPSEDVDIDDEE